MRRDSPSVLWCAPAPSAPREEEDGMHSSVRETAYLRTLGTRLRSLSLPPRRWHARDRVRFHATGAAGGAHRGPAELRNGRPAADNRGDGVRGRRGGHSGSRLRPVGERPGHRECRWRRCRIGPSRQARRASRRQRRTGSDLCVSEAQTPDGMEIRPESHASLGDTLRLVANVYGALEFDVTGATAAWSSRQPVVVAIDSMAWPPRSPTPPRAGRCCETLH